MHARTDGAWAAVAARLRVLTWWAAFGLARGALWLLVRLLLWPMQLLEWLADVRDAAEVEWLLACTGRRLVDRRRVAQVDVLAGLVRRFPHRSAGEDL